MKHLGVEGNIALGTDVDSLSVPLAHLRAHLSVPGGPLPMIVELSLSDPVIGSFILLIYDYDYDLFR